MVVEHSLYFDARSSGGVFRRCAKPHAFSYSPVFHQYSSSGLVTRFLSCAICLQCGHGHRNNWKCHGVVCNPLQKRRSVTASDVLIEVLVSKLAKTLRSCRTHHSHNLREDTWLVSSCIASVETDMGFFDIRCSTPKSCFKIIPQSQHPNTSCTNHLKLSIELVDCLTLKRRDRLADRKTARRKGLHLTCVRVCARASPRATVDHHAQHEVLRVWQER